MAQRDAMREALAEYVHRSWAGWMWCLFGRSRRNLDGTVAIPRELVERWTRQMNTAYWDLPEDEKRGDLAEADEILAVVEGELRGAKTEGKRWG